MVDLTPTPLASSSLSSATAGGAANVLGANSFDARASNMSQDSGSTTSFKETLAGLQSSDSALPAKSDPTALPSSAFAAQKTPNINISNSLAILRSDFRAPSPTDRPDLEDQLSSPSARPLENASLGNAFGPTVHDYSADGGDTIARLGQTDSAIRQAPDQPTGPEDTAAADNSVPLASATDLRSAMTAMEQSSPAESGFSSLVPAIGKVAVGADNSVPTLTVSGLSSLVPAIGKVTGAPEQLTGPRNQNNGRLQPPAKNPLAAEETAGSQTAGTGAIGNVAGASGGPMLKRKKKSDDLVSPTSSSNATTGAGSADLLPFSTLTLANGSTSGISGRAASVSGLNSQSAPAGLGDPAAEIGAKNDGREASNGPGSDFAFAVRFKSDTPTENNSGQGPGGESGAGAGPNANDKTLSQTQTANGSGAADLKMTPTGGSNLAGSNITGSTLTGENLAGSNVIGPGASPSQHPASHPAGSSAAADAAMIANSSAVDEIKPSSESAPPALRSVQVQITGQDNQRVDVKLIERPGALSMSVRAADGSLTRTLQEHLPELTTKLAEQQIPAEWWVPKTPSTGPVSEAASSGDTTKQGDSRSQGQTGSGSQDSGKQQGGRQGDQPIWVDELAAKNNLKTDRKEYIWHQ